MIPSKFSVNGQSELYGQETIGVFKLLSRGLGKLFPLFFLSLNRHVDENTKQCGVQEKFINI